MLSLTHEDVSRAVIFYGSDIVPEVFAHQLHSCEHGVSDIPNGTEC